MPQSKRSNRFKKSNPHGFTQSDSGANDQVPKIKNNCDKGHVLNNETAEKNDFKPKSSECENVNKSAEIIVESLERSPRKQKKNKFVKPNFDIEISCKPGPSNISTINRNICNTKPKQNEKKKSHMNISNENSLEWRIEERDIPHPKHVKYGNASHSQSSSGYSELSRGRQCTGNAVVSLIMLSDEFFFL